MDVIVNTESWIRAGVGGVMIGLAATLLLAFNGRIAGVSGVLGALVLDRKNEEAPWRVLFLVGLIVGAAICALLRPDLVAMTLQTGWTGMIVAGLVVGVGTRMGGGCTSGHGVCGMARLSQRSFVATLSFMVAGVVTVFVIRHVIGAGS